MSDYPYTQADETPRLDAEANSIGASNEECSSFSDLHQADFDIMPIEQVNQYLSEHGHDPERVRLQGEILAKVLIENINLREYAKKMEVAIIKQSIADKYNVDQLIQKLRLQIKIIGSQKEFATSIGFSASYLSDVLNKRRDPGIAFLRACGYEKVTLYRRIP